MGTGASELVVGFGEFVSGAVVGPDAAARSGGRREPGDGSAGFCASLGTFFAALGGTGLVLRFARDSRLAFFGLDRDIFGRNFEGTCFAAGGAAVSGGA